MQRSVHAVEIPNATIAREKPIVALVHAIQSLVGDVVVIPTARSTNRSLQQPALPVTIATISDGSTKLSAARRVGTHGTL